MSIPDDPAKWVDDIYAEIEERYDARRARQERRERMANLQDRHIKDYFHYADSKYQWPEELDMIEAAEFMLLSFQTMCELAMGGELQKCRWDQHRGWIFNTEELKELKTQLHLVINFESLHDEIKQMEHDYMSGKRDS